MSLHRVSYVRAVLSGALPLRRLSHIMRARAHGTQTSPPPERARLLHTPVALSLFGVVPISVLIVCCQTPSLPLLFACCTSPLARRTASDRQPWSSLFH